jgi:hypothetical protein
VPLPDELARVERDQAQAAADAAQRELDRLTAAQGRKAERAAGRVPMPPTPPALPNPDVQQFDPMAALCDVLTMLNRISGAMATTAPQHPAAREWANVAAVTRQHLMRLGIELPGAPSTEVRASPYRVAGAGRPGAVGGPPQRGTTRPVANRGTTRPGVNRVPNAATIQRGVTRPSGRGAARTARRG